MTYHARPDETTEWLNYLQPEGLVVGANVLREAGLPPERQTPRDTEVALATLGLDPEAPRDDDRRFVLGDPWRFFAEVLRWPASLVAGAPGGPASYGPTMGSRSRCSEPCWQQRWALYDKRTSHNNLGKRARGILARLRLSRLFFLSGDGLAWRVL